MLAASPEPATAGTDGSLANEGTNVQQVEQPADDARDAARLAELIHYPGCWDTAAYPTLGSAVREIINFKWSECAETKVCVQCDGKGQTRIHARPGSWRTCGECQGSGRTAMQASKGATDGAVGGAE